MGFEITFFYKESTEEGYAEDTKTKVVKVGTPCDDVGLEVAAGKIIAQLARRNILVIDVEVYEYTKKKINYRVTEEGIVLKNRKYKFDDGAVIGTPTDETPTDMSPDMMAMFQQFMEKQNKTVKSITPPVTDSNAIIRHEYFDPPEDLLKAAKKRGLAFTPQKRYAIYKEIPVSMSEPLLGLLYLVEDDKGNKVTAHANHFVPNIIRLGNNFDNYEVSQNAGSDDLLNWQGDGNVDMIDIRARR